jgi:two-component system phosphate regulon response regulator OmpR
MTASARLDKIVIVDDDARIRDLLRRYLSQEGFDVLLAEDARALERILQRETIDLLVLDWMLPGEDGMAICRRLRTAGNKTPIIMLTAKGEDIDRIADLPIGGHFAAWKKDFPELAAIKKKPEGFLVEDDERST